MIERGKNWLNHLFHFFSRRGWLHQIESLIIEKGKNWLYITNYRFLTTKTNLKALYIFRCLFTTLSVKLFVVNVQIFVYSCLLWKMEKQHSQNLSHSENESPFQKRTTSWKWKLIPTPISKNENISFFETAINKKYKERFKSVCWCQIQLIDNF